MRGSQYILAWTVTLALVAGVRADLQMPTLGNTAPSSVMSVASPAVDQLAEADSDVEGTADYLLLRSADTDHWVGVAPSATEHSNKLPGNIADQADPPSEERELSMPPLPGSARLFLGAMLSVGAWQVVRSARNAHLGALPDWYNSDAPAQIGHTVLCELTFDAMPACRFDEPAGVLPILKHRWSEPRLRIDSQRVNPSVDPRGPPACGIL